MREIRTSGSVGALGAQSPRATRPMRFPKSLRNKGLRCVNQVSGGGAWTSLGTFRFEVGTSGSVTLKDNFTGSAGNADAIKLVFVSQ